MKKAVLVIGGLSLLGYGLYRYFKKQATLLTQFTWKIRDIKNVKFSINELSMDISFLFTSVSDIEAQINKLYLDIFLDNKNVGFVSDEKQFIIPARGSSIVPIRISINPRAVFKNLVDFTLGIAKNKDLMLRMDGYADIKSGFIKTTLPIKYETSVKEYLKTK
jgi:hypothetical protein